MISVTKYVGLNKKTVEWINQYTALMTGKKIPVADCLATLTAGETDVTHKDGLQETAKTNLKNATKATEGAVTVRYKELSSMIDYIAGGIGKDSTEAAQLYAIRTEYTGGHQGGDFFIQISFGRCL